ncbi:hypothetical protein FHY03_000677 [Sphingomonas sp. BK345]|nr:hypothetical protein [Sphingomonas sp. BK345]
MRSMVEGGFRKRCAAWGTPSTTGLRPVVPLPASGEDFSRRVLSTNENPRQPR